MLLAPLAVIACHLTWRLEATSIKLVGLHVLHFRTPLSECWSHLGSFAQVLHTKQQNQSLRTSTRFRFAITMPNLVSAYEGRFSLMMTINWERCIFINRGIDEDLITEVTQQILQMRQKNNDSITIALDSPGGSVYLLKPLRGLVQSPNQDGQSCELVTVATHRAYSAAAMLLASGDYAVAMGIPNCYSMTFDTVKFMTLHRPPHCKPQDSSSNPTIENRSNWPTTCLGVGCGCISTSKTPRSR